MVNEAILNNKISSNFKKMCAQKEYSLGKIARLVDLSFETLNKLTCPIEVSVDDFIT